MANELGLRSLSFEVDNLQAQVDRLATEGYGLVGGIGHYADVWRMAYRAGKTRFAAARLRTSALRPWPPCNERCHTGVPGPARHDSFSGLVVTLSYPKWS